MEFEDKIDIKKIFLKYIPWWYIFLISIALAVGAAYVFNTLSEPVYSAKTTLLIREDGMASPLIPNLGGGIGRERWHNEIAILTSHTLMDKALQYMKADVSYYEIERILGLPRSREIYMDAPFRVKWDNNQTQSFEKRFRITILSKSSCTLEEINGTKGSGDNQLVQFGDHLEGQGHSFSLELAVPFDKEQHADKVYEFVVHNPHDLARRYLRNINVEPMGREYSVLEISFKATNRRRAVDLVANLTDMYIQQHLADKNHMAQNTINFVDDQLTEVSENLRDTELNLQQFRQRHQIMEVGPVATRLSQELSQLDQQKNIEQLKRQYYDLLMEYVHDDRDFAEVFGPSTLGIDDPLLNSVLMDLNNLHNERARMLLSTTSSTPSVQAIDQNIRHSKANLKENLESMKAANDIILNDLNQRINRIEQTINQLPQTERELINIQRMFNLSEATYNFLQEKRAEAGIGLASMIPDHKIIDPAHPDGTVAPRKSLNYTLAFGIGMIIPFIFIGMHGVFYTRIIDMEEVSRIVDYPVVGLIPHYPRIKNLEDPGIILFDETRSPIIESFRSMRSNLMILAPKTKSKLIVVTSTREKEGKSFTALNLAGSFDLLNRKTIFIEADMRKPSALFNGDISNNKGLSGYLAGKLNTEDIISQIGKNENLHFISSGKIPHNASELLESEAMDRLLERLQEFEYIIIDTPPVGLVSDAKFLLTKADIVLYVLRHGYSQHSDLDFLRKLIKSANLQKVALVINNIKSKSSRKGYGYGYGYGYGLGYGIGYGEDKKLPKKKHVNTKL